jgi:hypothetical protein
MNAPHLLIVAVEEDVGELYALQLASSLRAHTTRVRDASKLAARWQAADATRQCSSTSAARRIGIAAGLFRTSGRAYP